MAPTIQHDQTAIQHNRPRRRFQINASDPRAPGLRNAARQAVIPQEITRARALFTLNATLQRARESSLARGTRVTQKSQLAYWAEFCLLYEVDESNFGALSPSERLPSLHQIREEEDILAAFMAFIIAFPRRGRAQNTANYALQCISAVRSHYVNIHGKRPGLRDGQRNGGQLKTVVRGFQKSHPSKREARTPLLQQHLRAIRACLNLTHNNHHKVLWALWLTQWQGVLRSSDLIKKRKDADIPWQPSQETHRGRLSVDAARDTSGRLIGARFKLKLKPNKTDQAGTKNTVKSFVIDETPGALSAGQAIRDMLEADPFDNGLEATPLFRHPVTKKEITYEESNEALMRCLKDAGIPAEAAGTHSLRIGGATAYANTNNGGYAVSGFMGLWASSSRDFYMHACAPRIDMAALEIGRASNWEIAERPGPVGRYAS